MTVLKPIPHPWTDHKSITLSITLAPKGNLEIHIKLNMHVFGHVRKPESPEKTHIHTRRT